MKLFHLQILIGAPLSLFFGTIAALKIFWHLDFYLLIFLGLFSLSFLMLVSGVTSMLSFKIESDSAQSKKYSESESFASENIKHREFKQMPNAPRKCPNCGESFFYNAQTCLSCGWAYEEPDKTV